MARWEGRMIGKLVEWKGEIGKMMRWEGDIGVVVQ